MQIDLLSQIKKARQGTIKLAGCTFTFTRPTDAEAIALSKGELTECEIACMFVIGWADVKASDILPSAGSDIIEFEKTLWREWCSDRPDFWRPIASRVVESYKLHAAELAKAEKN